MTIGDYREDDALRVIYDRGRLHNQSAHMRVANLHVQHVLKSYGATDDECEELTSLMTAVSKRTAEIAERVMNGST